MMYPRPNFIMFTEIKKCNNTSFHSKKQPTSFVSLTVDHCRTSAVLLVHDEHPSQQ